MYHIYIYLSIFIHYKEWRFWKISYLNIFPYIPHNESIDMLIKEGWSFWGGKEINIFKIGWAILPLYFFTDFFCVPAHTHTPDPSLLPTKIVAIKSSWLVIIMFAAFLPHML